jgi:hypothetical protein
MNDPRPRSAPGPRLRHQSCVSLINDLIEHTNRLGEAAKLPQCRVLNEALIGDCFIQKLY